MTPCYFTDMSALGKLRINGADSEKFLTTMMTADMLPLQVIGGATTGLLLTGEAEIIDVAVIVRTGDAEFMVTTNPSVAHEVFEWLEAHAAISDDEGPVFPALTVSEQTDDLAVTVLYGEGTNSILDELIPGGLASALRLERLSMAHLDTVPAMILRPPFAFEGCFELFYPPQSREAVEHALLSFPEIDPASEDDYQKLRKEQGTWFEAADEAAYRHPDELDLMHLIREDQDFVGARALAKRLH
jgi:glycine cleavage system aminomethyltransferase T